METQTGESALLNVLLREDAWGPAATALALGVALWFLVRRWNAVSGRTLALGALNVFWGVWIAIMGTGHLSAVTVKAILGILPPDIHLWIAIPFGLALVVPGCRLVARTPALVRHDHDARREVMLLNSWLVCVLIIPAAPLVVVPLANLILLRGGGERVRPVTATEES